MKLGKVFGAWGVVAGLLFWNGLLAFGVWNPLFGRDIGEMLAAFIALIAIAGTSREFLASTPDVSRADAPRASALWLIMTLLFEWGFGRLMATYGPAVPRYGMWDGSYWPIIALAMASAPIVCLRRPVMPVGGIVK